jgi:hypothetical protein
MTTTRSTFLQFSFPAVFAVVLTASSLGCSTGSMTSARFTPSATPEAPGLVKLEERSRSGARVVVDVVFFGPEAALELNAFKFGIRSGNSDLVKFAPQPTYAQTALIADAGQTVVTDIDGVSDPLLVLVDVEKQGGGAGNGVAGASAVVIELTFDVRGSGATTLALVGVGAEPPRALDPTNAPIPAVNFDAATATVTAVTTGGGY